MVFKEMVAYLLDGKGGYTCSDDVQAEKHLYLGFQNLVQHSVDHVRQLEPDWTDAQLQDYVNRTDRGDIGQIMFKAKDCLAQHGYDVSTLPQVTVPEFGDISSLILKIGIGGAILAGTYAAKYFSAKNGYKL